MGGGTFFSNGTDADSNTTVTLTGARPGIAQAITDITYYALGTVTAFTLQVTLNDGTTNVAKIGGQVGGAATGPLGPYGYTFTSPIICTPNDNAKVTVTATGATATALNVHYKLVNC